MNKSKKRILGVFMLCILVNLSGCACKHEYDSGVITQKATCIEEGIKTYTCKLCKKEKTESIPLAEHIYNGGEVTQRSTCTEEGVKTFTCTICNEKKTEKIPLRQHTYIEEITKEPTFEEEGIKTFTCTVCGNSYTESIPVRDDKVVFTVMEKRNTPKNIDAWQFSPFVEFVYKLENMTDNDIKGIQGILTINDLFGEEILCMKWDVTGNVIPAHSSIIVEGYGLDINEFSDTHMKLYNTDFSDLKFEYDAVQIVYTDGTVEHYGTLKPIDSPEEY